MCCPILVDQPQEGTKPILNLENAVNPLLLKCRPTPNTSYFDSTSKIVLVNGPNGSGKTTLLKTIG
jgi:DNA mismatch repair ATPase MutS